jgi:hypothetical protein
VDVVSVLVITDRRVDTAGGRIRPATPKVHVPAEDQKFVGRGTPSFFVPLVCAGGTHRNRKSIFEAAQKEGSWGSVDGCGRGAGPIGFACPRGDGRASKGAWISH